MLSFTHLCLFVGVISIAACSKTVTGDCICRLDPEHPESGIVTCEGTVGGGQREECKLEDETSEEASALISVYCDSETDSDSETDTEEMTCTVK